MAYGVEYSPKEARFVWDRFRALGRLDNKYDDTLVEYYLAFMAMCKRVAGLPLSEEEELVSGSVEAVSEDKARKVLERVDFLTKLREEVVTNPQLRQVLEEHAELALDLPEWWIPGKHDYDLVVGAARHGLARMEYYVLNDIELSFKDVLKKSLAGEPLTDSKALGEWEIRREERKKSVDVNGESKETKEEEKNGKPKSGKKSRKQSGKSDISTVESAEENGDDESEKMEGEISEKSPTELKAAKEKLAIEKAKAVERSSIVAPQLNLAQMEAAIAKGGGLGYDQEMINDLMAQTYAASVRWPKDSVLHVRLQHIVQCLESKEWPVPANFSISEVAAMSGPATPEPMQNNRDTSTPLSEMSELSQFDDGNVLTHGGGLANRKKRGRRPLDYPDEKAKFRNMMNSGTPLSASSLVSSAKASTDDSMSDTSGRPGVEITPVEGEKAKGSKLESALDKMGLTKRKLSDAPADDKSKKKKRLDDLLSGLHAGKGTAIPEKKESAMDSIFRRATEGGHTDLTKLQEMLGPLGGNPADAKVQKWLADQMGVTPDRPITPGSSSTATSTKRPASTSSAAGGWMEWMSKLSGEEHVTVFNRSTGKKMSGTQGPKLKCLAQWLIENPMFEVDPKWAEEVRGHDANARKKGPGRPPLDDMPASKANKSASPGVGPTYNSMAGLGVDPKNPMSALAALDPKNPYSLATLYGLDPKKLDPMTAAMLGLGDPKNPMKMDPMMLAALSMDPKTLQAMGIDPKKLTALAQPATSKPADVKAPAAKAPGANANLDPMLLAAFGMDPKNPKLDPMTAAVLGLDPKNPKFDPMVLAHLGLDPKNPNSTLLAAMAAMDPNHQLAAMYGMMPPGYPGAGMDIFGKGKHSPAAKDAAKSLPSPSHRAREGPSPRPPSRASASSRDGRSTPSRSSAPQTSHSQSSPRTSAAPGPNMNMFGGMNPALFGLDPKMLASMDPKLLQAAGIDPKMLSNLDPKMLGMMDPRMASMTGMDLKALAGMDPKLLQAAGIDPNLLSKMLDPKQLAGMDPKVLASLGIDPKMLEAQPKQTQAPTLSQMDSQLLKSMGLDPKMLAQVDPNILKSMGIDPKMLGIPDPKETSRANQTNDYNKMLASMGLDPKMLAGMDPKLLGFDPKMLSDPKLLAGMDPRMFGLDPKMFGSSGAMPSSVGTTKSYSSSNSFSTVPTSATSTQMSLPSSFASGLDPRLLGLDPKMLQGLDEKALKSLGLDPNIVKSLLATDGKSDGKLNSKKSSTNNRSNTSTTFSGLDPKMFPGVDPKLLQGMDPKMLSMMDPKTMQAMMDPKTMQAMMDPKMMASMYGLDMKMLASMDPKMLQAYGLDPKWFDPKNMPNDPKAFAGIDPKLLGLDPNMLKSMDPKLLQSMGIDLKSLGMDPKGHPAPPAASLPATTSQSNAMSPMDPKLLAMAGIDVKMLAGMDPKVLASYGIDAKMLGQLDPKNFPNSTTASAATKPTELVAGMDPKMLAAAGIDPNMIKGMDPKMLAQMGLDPKTLAAALDPKNIAKSMAGMDPKALAGMDPKMLASMGLDPKLLQGMGAPMDSSKGGPPDPKMMSNLDPKLLGGMDPKLLAGMDPKMLASMGIDPKMLAGMPGMDPKMMAGMPAMPGMDPKMMAAAGMPGMDPKMMAAAGMPGMDMKNMMNMMGMDMKMLAGMDPKMLASLGLDPKVLSDPNLMAMYTMGMMPPMSGSSPMSNGVGNNSGTPLPSSKSTTSAKPKAGTVAAALLEKKESEKARGVVSDHGGEKPQENHDETNSDVGEGSEEDFRRGLTSEERVLLREKKKERLMKENESEQMDEGLNLSVCKPNGGTEHPTKLEALLAKPIEDLNPPPHAMDKSATSINGEPPRTEGV